MAGRPAAVDGDVSGARSDGALPGREEGAREARAVLAVGSAVLAVSHLVLVDAWRDPGAGALLPAVAALAVAAWAAAGLPPLRPIEAGEPEAPRRADRVRWAVAVVAAAGGAMAVAALHARGDGRPSGDYLGILALWSASVTAATLAWALPAAWLVPGGVRRWLAARREPLVDAAALLAIALLLRVAWLDRVPSIVTGDEGVFGNASRWMARGEGGHMFGTFWANATLYLVPHALLEPLIGPSPWALRLPTALGAALAAPSTYALGRSLFGRRVGLAAGALLAFNHLHVHLSRDGLGHGLDAALAAVAAWGLGSGVLRQHVGRAAVGGLALGLAQYGYVGARLVDLVAAAWVGWLAAAAALAAARAPRGARRAALGARLPAAPVGAALFVAAVAAGPMARWALVRPGDYLSRLGAEGLVQSGAAADRLAAATPLALAARQLIDAAMALGAAPASAFYFARFPALDVLSAALLALGIALALRRPLDPRLSLLGLSVVGAVATLALARDAAVSVYRVSGVLPAALVLASVALWTVLDALLPSRTAAARLAAVVVAGVCAFHAGVYWRGFAPGCGYWDPLTALASEIGRTVRRDGGGGAAFVLGRPDFRLHDFESARYLAGRTVWRLPGPGDAGSVAELPLGPVVPAPDEETAAAVFFDVPVGMAPAELALAVRTARRPTLVFAAPARDPALDALLEAVPGASARAITRCDQTLGRVAAWPAAPPGR